MSYSDNMYGRLRKKRGLCKKYEHAGIYSISIGDELVYIGKSHNMLKRLAQHMVGIKLETEKKYMIMAEKQRRGYPINFNVMYYAKSDDYDSIDEEIGVREGELIREYMPPLNTQIPDKDNWRRFTCREIDEAWMEFSPSSP